MKSMILATYITDPLPPPYSGVCERFMFVLATYTSVLLNRVDSRLWCFAHEHLEQTWNLTPRREYKRGPAEWNGKTPREIVSSSYDGLTIALPGPSSIDDLRRFGCVAWVMTNEGRASGVSLTQEEIQSKKHKAKWRRGVYLGHSRESAGHLVGFWKPNATRAKGYEFVVRTSLDVRFREDVTVSNIDMLKEGKQPTFDELDRAVLGEKIPASAAVNIPPDSLEFDRQRKEVNLIGGEQDQSASVEKQEEQASSVDVERAAEVSEGFEVVDKVLEIPAKRKR